MNLHTRLKELVEELNITQRQLSAELNLAPTTLNGYLNGHREPDFCTLIRIANYFDVSADYLLGLSGNKKPSPSSLSPSEGALRYIYRSLEPDWQKLLMEQAKLYLSHFESQSREHK